MGSPSSRLKTLERLRPWLESGVEYILRPGGGDGNARPSGFSESVSPPSEQSSAPVGQSFQPQVQPQAQPQVEPQARPPRSVGRQPERATPRPENSSPSAPRTSVSAFPEPWATALAKIPANHKMVWTYMELGLDFGGQVDARRKALLGSLIRSLKLPAGTVGFWPASALVGGALQPNREFFWKGWRQWQTPHIVCFGEESLQTILPEADPGLTTHMMESVMVHVLPSMPQLLRMLPHEQQLVVEPLATLRW